MADATPDLSKPDNQDKDKKPDDDKGDKTKSRIEDLVSQRETEKSRADAAEAKLKEIEDASKKAADDEAKKKGEFKKLLEDREAELEKLKGEHDTSKKTLEAYEKTLKSQIDSALGTVTDEKKKATVAKLLEGKSVADQAALLPELLEAIGTPAPSGFGNKTPVETGTKPGTVDAKKEEFKKLYDQSKQKPLSPLESRRFRELSNELREPVGKELEETRKKQVDTEIQDDAVSRFS